MSITAFQISGNTALLTVTSASSATATQVCTGSQQGMYLANPSTIPVYFAAGNSSAVQAACPTTAVPCPGMCLPPNGTQTVTIPPQGWLAAATSAGSAVLFATPGFYAS